MILGNMGNLAYDEEDFAESSVLYRQAITIFRETGSQIGEAVYLANLGRVQLRVGELVDAKDYLTQGLQITRQLRDRGQMVFGLWSFSQLNYEAQNYERAARLLGASDSLRDEIGSTLSTSAIEEHRVLQQAVQAALGDAEYQAHYQSGRTMNWNNAVTFALEE
ncbi:MAG: tetratricopeptide repeat protein [Armatimonadetes bacterium]|nr:tetratricopeptide repeat protein [Armatimonadota bacterium]